MRKGKLFFLILSAIILIGINSGNAQGQFTIVAGQDKTFTEFNYHDAYFENCYNNPDTSLPWHPCSLDSDVPSVQTAISEDYYASVSVLAQPGSNGRAYAIIGVVPSLDSNGYTWEEALDLPVKVTFDFDYTLKSSTGIWGSSDAEIRIIPFAIPWYDTIGAPNFEGEISRHAIEIYNAKVRDLAGFGFLVRSHAHTYNNSASAMVTINSIKVEFDHSGEMLNAFIDIDPNTLNLKSHGNYITCYISFANSDLVGSINFSTIQLMVNGNSFYPLAAPSEIITRKDGTKQFMIKFDRIAVQNILAVGPVEFTITGNLASGQPFSGKDSVNAINP